MITFFKEEKCEMIRFLICWIYFVFLLLIQTYAYIWCVIVSGIACFCTFSKIVEAFIFLVWIIELKSFIHQMLLHMKKRRMIKTETPSHKKQFVCCRRFLNLTCLWVVFVLCLCACIKLKKRLAKKKSIKENVYASVNRFFADAFGIAYDLGLICTLTHNVCTVSTIQYQHVFPFEITLTSWWHLCMSDT